jgi:glycosyltransferase involved in cell wall biosynthesis
MKEMLYKDFQFRYEINSPDCLIVPQKEGAKDILFITHELSQTGAPVILQDLVGIILENGDFPVVLSLQDGPLKQKFLEMGVSVIIDESVRQRHWIFERFARNFDLVIVNSLSCYDAIYTLSNSLPPVMWWIHEGSYALSMMMANLPYKLGKNIHVFSISDYTTAVLKSAGFSGYQIEHLSWGVNEFDCSLGSVENELFTFVISGSVESRKGQDIVIEAISKLDLEISRKARFIFVGKPLDDDIFALLCQAARENSNIEYHHGLSRDNVLQLYQTADCMLIPSRDEPMSLVAVESSILSKPFICSDRTGIAKFVIDYKNGMIFQSGNSDNLADKLAYAVRNKDQMRVMGTFARKIYDRHFSFDDYKIRILNAIANLMES